MDGYPEAVDREPRPAWQAVAVGLVILLTVAIVGTLVFARLHGQTPPRTGRSLGAVTVTAAVDFTCRLPVTAYGQTAAVISFPDGGVTQAAGAPSPAPGGKGMGPYSYDAQLARWVPVPRGWVSPDGRKYAFATQTSGIPGQAPTGDVRIHDIVSGKDATVWQGSGNAQILGWNGTTLVFNLQVFGPGPSGGPETWGADAAGGQARRIGPNPAPTVAPGQSVFFGGGAVGGGAVWGLTSSQPPPTGPPQPGQPVSKGPDTLTRLDLRDGTVSRWYSAPGYGLNILGVDAQGHPIVSVNQFIMMATPPPPGFQPPAPRLFVVTGPDQATQLTGGSSDTRYLSGPVADSHGTWFSAPGQLWLYRAGALTKVADIPSSVFPPPTPPPGMPQPASKPGVAPPPGMPTGPYVQVAGACT